MHIEQSKEAGLIAAILLLSFTGPGGSVIVTDDGGRASTLLLGPSSERRGNQPSAYAAVAERGPLALVSASALADPGRGLRC